jgi:hypothetical protein
MKIYLSFFLKTFLIFSFLISCDSSSGGDELGPVDLFNIDNSLGVWVMNPLCEDYLLTGMTISLDEELPDSVNVEKVDESNIFIMAGDNNIVASINNAGIFEIESQPFLAQVVLLGSLTDIPTNIQGNGYLNDSTGNIDVIFSFENILSPGTIDSINCSIDLSR